MPFYGLVILCHDDEHLRDLLPRLKRSYVTYGVSASADYQAAAIYHEAGCVCFTVSIRGVVQGEVGLPLPDITTSSMRSLRSPLPTSSRSRFRRSKRRSRASRRRAAF